MHAGKVLYSLCAGKHGAQYKTNFLSLKAVLAFPTLMLATLGKWATTHDRVIFLDKNCSWTSLPGSTRKHCLSRHGGWSRSNMLPLLYGFAGSMHCIFYWDRSLLPKKRTGNLEASRYVECNKLSDEIKISSSMYTETKTTLPWKMLSSLSSAPLN